MITKIHGILEACQADQAILHVGGFSVRVYVPSSTLHQLQDIGTKVTLHTHFHLREDAMTLYGFSREGERDAFERLIAVNGVGPRVALALLSAMDAPTLYQAIADEDQQRLALTPGVGKRLAARLILELKGKLPSEIDSGSNGDTSPSLAGKIQSEVLEVLIGLGYTAAEAQSALRKLPTNQPMSLEEQVTFALRSFTHSS